MLFTYTVVAATLVSIVSAHRWNHANLDDTETHHRHQGIVLPATTTITTFPLSNPAVLACPTGNITSLVTVTVGITTSESSGSSTTSSANLSSTSTPSYYSNLTSSMTEIGSQTSLLSSSSTELTGTNTTLATETESSTTSFSITASVETSGLLSLTSSISISIVATASPVSTVSNVTAPSTTITPTITLSSGMATGTPNPAALLCGVHGYPIGDYSMAEYWEDTAGVPVTLLGCYDYCTTGYGYNMGCRSYEFFPEPGTGAPRCRLYDGSVAQSLASITPQVPNVWYDLGCGAPM